MNEEKNSFGVIIPKQEINSRMLYEHQRDAMKGLDIINRMPSFSTLIVLPTGGGKTYTASVWLLKNALNQKKKILWIAHRQMLLDQAAESFHKYAHFEFLPNIGSFSFRVISGAQNHSKVSDIKPSDDLLIVSKDSIGRNLNQLDDWLQGQDELYFVIDEAHHAAAKTYRKVIEYLKAKVDHLKIIGLTATPFRTDEKEKSLLSKIFTDGVKNEKAVMGDIGISYKIGLQSLINKKILSAPIFECYETEEKFGEEIGIKALESIQNFDVIPDEIANRMAQSALRNKLIVETYKEKQNEYGQTIVFAINVLHAITLSKLFNNAGIPTDYIVSGSKDLSLEASNTQRDNSNIIEQYREGKLKVLINVNILTEGVDLPQTKSVFLVRPTVSTILMTQMVGRALRGTKAGGTDIAYIVSFIDNWKNIAFTVPESIFYAKEETDFEEDAKEKVAQVLRLIYVSKIEEFASILDETIDTLELEKVPFIERIPIGMYSFSYLHQNGTDSSHQVMVYNHTYSSYKNFMDDIPKLFSKYNVTEEYPSQSVLDAMESECRERFFYDDMIPPYNRNDIINILKYYAQYETIPEFYTFDEIDRKKLDLSLIANHIWDEDMGIKRQTQYLEEIWNSEDDNILRIYFGKKSYFIKHVNIEIMKKQHPDIYGESCCV